MIKGLQIKLTGFCVVISAMILTAMSLLCLHISEKNMDQNEYHTFENTVYAVISYLEGQSVISHEWVLRMESGHDLTLWLYDNGKPLLINSLASASHGKKTEQNASLAERVIAEAQKKNGVNVLSSDTSYTLTQHTTFIFSDGNNRYYAAALLVPGQKSGLGAVILHPLTAQTAQIHRQRRDFFLAALLALTALAAFFWFFTGIILRPVEESRKKQARFVAAASHELRTPLAVVLSSQRLVPAGASRRRKSSRVRPGHARSAGKSRVPSECFPTAFSERNPVREPPHESSRAGYAAAGPHGRTGARAAPAAHSPGHAAFRHLRKVRTPGSRKGRPSDRIPA